MAIPFYSNLGFLREALASLVVQTDRDWTAVVVDDCSPTAGASSVVEDLGDPRLRYVCNPVNLGLAGNFNRCLTEAGTDVVAIFHADDLLETNYVATIRGIHRDAPDAAVVAPMAAAIDSHGSPIDTAVDKLKRRMWPGGQRHSLRGDAGLARLMHAFFVYCPAMSYRPALLPDQPFDPRWRQVMDLDLFARVLLNGGTIELDRTTVYRYRRHDGTVTSQNARSFTRLDEETRLAYEVAALARAQHWRRTAFAARLHWSQRLNGVVAVASSLRSGESMGRGDAIRDLLSVTPRPSRGASRH
ncbi:MAG: glycosyltransferase family 2 protein [Ilumatobacteraceae bacterium]